MARALRALAKNKYDFTEKGPDSVKEADPEQGLRHRSEGGRHQAVPGRSGQARGPERLPLKDNGSDDYSMTDTLVRDTSAA
ncbi:hypothetical protein AB0C13_04340 [Streptomyces sp. NPDC049099]|uniref:hypothetical protein n=1 Tax=Streptomyces sp. NPDC049099 TaxID=3155768 RepID=UPI00341811F5